MKLCDQKDAGKIAARRAFSLIELLVVIAVILLLARILMPALEKARDVAHQAQCASNLHQLGVAFMTYGADYRHFPGICNDNYPQGETDWVHYASSSAVYCAPKSNPDPLKRSAIGNYANSSDRPCRQSVFTCPMDEANTLGISYDMNANIAHLQDYHGAGGPINVSRIQHPSETYLLIEPSVHTTADRAMACTGQTIADWHNGGANSLYCDGHVKWALKGTNTTPGTLMYDVNNCKGWGPSNILDGPDAVLWVPPTVKP